MRSVVITGVSTGIGYAAAADLVSRGWRVFGSVRRAEDAARVQAALGEGFSPLLFDVSDEAAVAAAAAQVETALAGAPLAGLVNNAGVAVSGAVLHTPLQEYRRQFEVNFFGVVAVTQAFLPLLGARRNAPPPPGRIVNISSVSGRIAYPFLSPYAASKHALEAFSDSLRRELVIYGVDVILIEPGSVVTPIWDKAEAQDLSAYAGSDYEEIMGRVTRGAVRSGRRGIPVEAVVATIRTALESPRPKARYALPRRRLTGWLLPRWLPDRWFDRLAARTLGLKRIAKG